MSNTEREYHLLAARLARPRWYQRLRAPWLLIAAVLL